MSRILFGLAVSYALGGVAAGLAGGGEFLRSVNEQGFVRWPMILAAFVLPLAALILRLAARCGGEVGAFYRRLSWAFVWGGVLWGRVGWLRLSWAEEVRQAGDLLGLLILPAAVFAVLAAYRVASASKTPIVRASLLGLVVCVVATGAYCLAEAVLSLALTPAGTATVQAATTGGIILAALAAAASLPPAERRSTS